jgi:hypothetical protein
MPARECSGSNPGHLKELRTVRSLSFDVTFCYVRNICGTKVDATESVVALTVLPMYGQLFKEQLIYEQLAP